MTKLDIIHILYEILKWRCFEYVGLKSGYVKAFVRSKVKLFIFKHYKMVMLSAVNLMRLECKIRKWTKLRRKEEYNELHELAIWKY
jgi:hypothetical protein